MFSGTLVILVGLLVKVKSDVRISVIVACSLISLESIAILALTSRVAKLRKKGPEIPKGPQFHDGEDIELNTISAKVDEENEDIGNHILSNNDLQPKDLRRKSGAEPIPLFRETLRLDCFPNGPGAMLSFKQIFQTGSSVRPTFVGHKVN